MGKKEDDLRYRRSEKGLISKIYSHQKEKSIKRGHGEPTYNKEEFSEWMMTSGLFNDLFIEWKCSDYDKNLTPSVDRLNDNIGYTLDNIQLMTWKDNNSKNHRGRIFGISNGNMRPIKMYGLSGILICEFYSIAEASRYMQIEGRGKNLEAVKSGISNVLNCNENRETAYGHKWRYTNE